MSNSKTIQEEIGSTGQLTGTKFEQIAHLSEIECMQDNVVSLLGTEMTFDLGQNDKKKNNH